MEPLTGVWPLLLQGGGGAALIFSWREVARVLLEKGQSWSPAASIWAPPNSPGEGGSPGWGSGGRTERQRDEIRSSWRPPPRPRTPDDSLQDEVSNPGAAGVPEITLT